MAPWSIWAHASGPKQRNTIAKKRMRGTLLPVGTRIAHLQFRAGVEPDVLQQDLRWQAVDYVKRLTRPVAQFSLLPAVCQVQKLCCTKALLPFSKTSRGVPEGRGTQFLLDTRH